MDRADNNWIAQAPARIIAVLTSGMSLLSLLQTHFLLMRIVADMEEVEVTGFPSQRQVKAKSGQKRWNEGSMVHALPMHGDKKQGAALNAERISINALLGALKQLWFLAHATREITRSLNQLGTGAFLTRHSALTSPSLELKLLQSLCDLTDPLDILQRTAHGRLLLSNIKLCKHI